MDQSFITENTERSDPEYSSAFNAGYLIAMHKPNLSDKMLVSLNNLNLDDKGIYFKGLRYGMLEGDIQKSKQRFRGTDEPSHDKENDKDIDR